jgi:hypothetical protein
MPQKPVFQLPPPLASARVPATHVQATVIRVAQAKLPEGPASANRPIPAAPKSAQASPRVTQPKAPAAVRPVAPHVQSALARITQAKLGQRKNSVPERHAPEPVSAKSAIQLAAAPKKKGGGKGGGKGGAGGGGGGGGGGDEKKSPGLDFDGMRKLLADIEEAAPSGKGGKSNYSVNAGATLTKRHDELLGAGQHHGDRGLTLKQLKDDIENKLSTHGQSLK